MTEYRFVLVRHGETVGNSTIRYHGRTDVELSALGRAQMRAAAEWLNSQHGISQYAPVLTSPLRRAIEAARIIAGSNATLIEIAEFAEIDFGLFESLTAEEIKERYPAEFDAWKRDRLGAAYEYPGGENRAGFIARVERGIERILPLMADEQAASREPAVALLVAHRGVIRAITSKLVGREPEIELGSVQILVRNAPTGTWRVEMLDVTEHLAAVA